MLAAKLLRDQDIEVLALFFETPFFSSSKAIKSAQILNLPIKVVDISKKHLRVVKDPKHGYGNNMNPCIDCHALMFREAGGLLEKEGANFIITGEVLGQRPMSQNRKSLSIVAFESGYQDLILRPLSAGLLPVSIPEEKGWVKRDRLMCFSGRSRRPQMELARQLNIKKYPSPAGGCLLTDQVFSRRLKDLFSMRPLPDFHEIELLKLGRHFRIGPHTKVIVGRNKIENKAINAFKKTEDLLLIPASVPGPTAIVTGDLSTELEEQAASITISYSDAEDNKPTDVRSIRCGTERILKQKGLHKDKFKHLMI